MEEVYIVASKRTPIGSFGGKLASFSATELGAKAIQAAISQLNCSVEEVDEVLMGNVLSAGVGQAPAKQAAHKAKLPDDIPCTTINKVCASGLKAITLAANSITLGQSELVVAGGMESMSNVPYYVPKARYGHTYGHGELTDGLLHDGLWDPYHRCAMGNCAEVIAKEMKISREEQDRYAQQSYERATTATDKGDFREEIEPISIPQRKGEPTQMNEDEEYRRVVFEKIPKLRPAFEKDGTVTAANASTINDGAAALILCSKSKAQALGLQPLAKVIAQADAEQSPVYFTTSPTLAVKKVLDRAKLRTEEVDFFEINEAFSVVALVNMQLLNISEEKLNVLGGAVALGHPLGCSGARILTTLLTVLKKHNAKRGVAAICNGGGGASAILVERC